MSAAFETRSQARCFGGTLLGLAHASRATGTEMKVSAFVPAQAEHTPCPALVFLAGLECTQDTFVQKAGAQRLAAELGLILVAPDTSPRGAGVPGENDDWDLGTSASFYVDATQAPWAANYRMATYVNEELPSLMQAALPVRTGAAGIMGHSMGGHGAIVSALRHPGIWRSLSAIAPICNPTEVAWGHKAFSAYLGADPAAWREWDASLLMAAQPFPGPVLVDQGLADKFLATQLRPETLEKAAAKSGQALTMRRHDGYDHSYWFIQTVIGDHISHHARALHN